MRARAGHTPNAPSKRSGASTCMRRGLNNHAKSQANPDASARVRPKLFGFSAFAQAPRSAPAPLRPPAATRSSVCLLHKTRRRSGRNVLRL